MNLEHLLALGILGAAALAFILTGQNENAIWSLGILAGYAFKNGVAKRQGLTMSTSDMTLDDINAILRSTIDSNKSIEDQVKDINTAIKKLTTANFSLEHIRQSLMDALQSGTPEEVRERTDAILTGVFVTGGAVSLLDVGTDFLDFGIGQSLHQMVSPIIDATIAQPMKDAMQKGFRFAGPSTRLILPMVEAGLVPGDMLRRALVDQGYKDEYVHMIMEYSFYRTQKITAEANARVQALQDKVKLYPIEQEQARVEKLMARSESQAEALEALKLTAPLDNDVSQLNGLITRLEHTADVLEESTDEKVILKTADLAFLLLKRARRFNQNLSDARGDGNTAAAVRDLRTQAQRLRAIVDARRIAIETAKLNRDISNLQDELDAITQSRNVIDALRPSVNFFERPGVHIRPEGPVREGGPSRGAPSSERSQPVVLNEVFPVLAANLPSAKVASAQALSDAGVSLMSSPKPGELAVFTPGQQFFEGGTLQPSNFVPSSFVNLSPLQQHEFLEYGSDPAGYVSMDDYLETFRVLGITPPTAAERRGPGFA